MWNFPCVKEIKKKLVELLIVYYNIYVDRF